MISQRQQLLNAASYAFARQGYSGASVRAIALSANINGAMVSYYFGSKEGLFCSVLEDRDEAIRERIAWAEKSAGPGQAVAEFRTRAYLNCVLVDFPYFLHIVLGHAILAGDDFPNAECRQLITKHAAFLTPDQIERLATELITGPAPLMDRPESDRQALADKLSPTPKPRRKPTKVRNPHPKPPTAEPNPEPEFQPPNNPSDDFLDGFLD